MDRALLLLQAVIMRQADDPIHRNKLPPRDLQHYILNHGRRNLDCDNSKSNWPVCGAFSWLPWQRYKVEAKWSQWSVAVIILRMKKVLIHHRITLATFVCLHAEVQWLILLRSYIYSSSYIYISIYVTWYIRCRSRALKANIEK